MKKTQDAETQVVKEYPHEVDPFPPMESELPQGQVVAKPEHCKSAGIDGCRLVLELDQGDGQTESLELYQDWLQMVAAVCFDMMRGEENFFRELPFVDDHWLTGSHSYDRALASCEMPDGWSGDYNRLVVFADRDFGGPVCVIEKAGSGEAACVSLKGLVDMVFSYVAYGVSGVCCEECGLKTPITADMVLREQDGTPHSFTCPCGVLFDLRGRCVTADGGEPLTVHPASVECGA